MERIARSHYELRRLVDSVQVIGGGGSFNAGDSPVNLAGQVTGDGFVTVTYYGPADTATPTVIPTTTRSSTSVKPLTRLMSCCAV